MKMKFTSSYELTNLAATEEKFVWAIHPLLRLQPGDQLELPASTRALLNGEAGLMRLIRPSRNKLRENVCLACE